MRKPVVIVTGTMLLLAGCGSSAATSSGKPTTQPTASSKTAPVAAASVPPTVGPTNPNASPAPKPVTVDLQVVKRRGEALVIAPVVVHGKTYEFVVDTGASATLIDQNYAKALGLKKTGSAPIPVKGVTGSGSAYLATISDWMIGRSKIPTSTVTVSSLQLGDGLVGLLGSDVLSTFGKVTIDYNAQRASLG